MIEYLNPLSSKIFVIFLSAYLRLLYRSFFIEILSEAIDGNSTCQKRVIMLDVSKLSCFDRLTFDLND